MLKVTFNLPINGMREVNCHHYESGQLPIRGGTPIDFIMLYFLNDSKPMEVYPHQIKRIDPVTGYYPL